MKRACESCLKRPGVRRVVVGGVPFHVCTTCAPALPARRGRAA